MIWFKTRQPVLQQSTRNWGLKSSFTATSEWFKFDGNDSLLILIGVHWAMDWWKILLHYRQRSLAQKCVSPPRQLTGRISAIDYKTMRSSSISRSTMTIVALVILLIVKTLKIVMNYHPFLWELTRHYSDSPVSRAAWYATFDVLFGKIVLLPIVMFGSLLSVKSGFGLFAMFLASLLEISISALLAAVSIVSLATLTEMLGEELLFLAPITSNLIGLVAMAYYIEFIVPGKLSKVAAPNRRLLLHLKAIASDVGFPVDSIYIDSSVVTAPNAYYVGVFGANMIAVTPSLIKIMDNRQVTAVVAHELGHWVHHHNSVQLLFSVVTVLAIGYGLFLAYGCSIITQTFRFQETPQPIIPVYLWVTYGSSQMVDFIDGISSVVGCRNEYTADGFAVEKGLGSSLKSALLTLAARSKVFPLFDRLYSAWFLKHPTIIDRIKRIEH